MRSDSRIITLVVLGSTSLILAFVQTGCIPYPHVGSGTASVLGGQDAITVHMPFEQGYVSKCMQGAFGSYSHTGTSTKYDVDFDTPNSQDDLVFVPASGVAYVHDENTSTGFGLHINIDLGDGTYLVLAHLSAAFVGDGDEVGAGQILGYEGTTGNSTGDHVHFGRHEGDAAQNAAYGTSVEGLQIVLENESGLEEELVTQDMVCDLSTGDLYTSLLPTPAWHPDGTLIMMPDHADVYVLEDGTKRLIEDEAAFWSRGYDFNDVVFVSARELACYDNGADLTGEGLVAGVQDGVTTWLLTGTGADREKRRVVSTAWSQVLASWGITASTLDDLPTAEGLGLSLDDFADRGNAVFRDGALLKESSASDVYVVGAGIAEPIIDWDTYLGLGFHDRTILEVAPGAIAAIQGAVGSCATNTYCVSMEEVSVCGGSDAPYGAASHEDTGSGMPDTGFDTGYWEPDGVEDTQEESSEPSSGASDSSAGLILTWTAPSSRTEARITLSGEYTESSGYSYGWQELGEVASTSRISYTASGAASGDTLRFSVEFEDSSGNVSWSCLAPFPPGTVQGTANATYNGASVTVSAADDPTSDGCGLLLTVP